jgi:hypothetical protein
MSCDITFVVGLMAQSGTVMVGLTDRSLPTWIAHEVVASALVDFSDELPHAATPKTMVAARARTPIDLRIAQT